MFVSQSEAKVTNLRISLANTKKLNMSTVTYLTKMQGVVDELAMAGCPREHVSFVLAGLGGSYNSLVAALGVQTTPISLSHLYALIDAYDHRQEMLCGFSDADFETSANAAQRQRRRRPNQARGDHGDRRDDWRPARRDDRAPSYGRGGGRAPPGGGRGRGRGRRRTTPWVDDDPQV
jgi:hypothetical protein